MALQVRSARNNWMHVLVRNDVEVYVLFANKTNRKCDLYWIDPHTNVPIYYTSLRPLQQLCVNTYRSHPWLFRDGFTGERLQVKNQILYWPVPTSGRHPVQPERIVSIRQQVNIHNPLKSLMENCLWSLSREINKRCDRPEHAISSFCLPKTLKEQLQSVSKHVVSYRENVAKDSSSSRLRR